MQQVQLYAPSPHPMQQVQLYAPPSQPMQQGQLYAPPSQPMQQVQQLIQLYTLPSQASCRGQLIAPPLQVSCLAQGPSQIAFFTVAQYPLQTSGRCSGKCKHPGSRGQPVGRRCMLQGKLSYGLDFYCHHHYPVKCIGTKLYGASCYAPAIYGNYCCAAHDPANNLFKPEYFRENQLPVSCEELLATRGWMDAYLGCPLYLGETQRDHIMECQIPAHVFNLLTAQYRYKGYNVNLISIEIPAVKEFTNRYDNLAPTHQDVNQLKGGAIKTFLDKRTYAREALFTSCLQDALSQVFNDDDMEVRSLNCQATATIRSSIVYQTQQIAYYLDGQADNDTGRALAREFWKLSIHIGNS